MRVLPWLAAQRRESPGAYDCDTCKTAYDETQRAHLRCGWLPRRRWRKPLSFRGVPGCRVGGVEGPELCPGYSTQLPRVLEVARLWGWEKRGSIDTHVRVRRWTLSEPVLDLVDVFSAEQAECERWDFERRTRKG